MRVILTVKCYLGQEYDTYGGLAVNMRVFGSSGFQRIPKGGVLRNYIKYAKSLLHLRPS